LKGMQKACCFARWENKLGHGSNFFLENQAVTYSPNLPHGGIPNQNP
jgi:hypothetical protein